MPRKIIFSTGNYFKVYSDDNRKIDSCLKLDVEGVEILLAVASQIKNFRLKKGNIKRLKKLELNTIHLPFALSAKKRYIYFYNSRIYRDMMKRVAKIADMINAVNINLHAHQLKNPKLLADFPFHYTFENITESHGWGMNDYKMLFKKNPEFGMLLDTSHAIRTCQLKEMVKNFRKKINFIHFSCATGPGHGNDHYMAHRYNEPNKKLLDAVKNLKCPVIIEAGAEEGLTQKDMEKEVAYVRKWLK